jgi:hypothetical protein
MLNLRLDLSLAALTDPDGEWSESDFFPGNFRLLTIL